MNETARSIRVALAHKLTRRSVTRDERTLRTRVKRASTLVLVMEGSKLLLYNYLNGACVDYTTLRAAVLMALSRWTPLRHLLHGLRSHGLVVASEIPRLITSGFVLVEGSPAADTDRQYESEWEWDLRAGLFHLSIKDPAFLSDSETVTDLEARVLTRPAVDLYQTNDTFERVSELRMPAMTDALLSVLSRRRSRRAFSKKTVPLEILADSLYAGLGITGFIVDAVKGMGRLPLKMTPSGGARNPYEAYVYARRIDGLDEGIYHYSALEHSLGRLEMEELPPPSAFIADQVWADNAAALVFLVANLRRTMWKYSHPMTYRGVLIEAGHIAQNIMILAAARGLSTVPTAALSDALLERVLRLNRVTQAVIYVVALGFPSGKGLDHGRFQPLRRHALRRRGRRGESSDAQDRPSNFR